MRVGILVPSIGAFGQKGFYNAQEIGLAKALDSLCHEVHVYKLTDLQSEAKKEHIEGCKNTAYHLIPSMRIGNNGFPDMRKLDNTLDALVFFSDTQLVVPEVHRWAEKHKIILIPYNGVLESHSDNKLKRKFVDVLFRRNVAVYKKHTCLAKNPDVAQRLKAMGVSDVTVAPVGLDLSLLNKEYEDADIVALKMKYGYAVQNNVLLFVGRMSEEKQPLRMVELFKKIHERNPDYRLLMVGRGELHEAVVAQVESYGLTNYVQLIDRIPNKHIWELYRISDWFVNLSQQEIFGMAILEAMYYGCKVVAWKAPGPSFIIEDGACGFLANSNDGILEVILKKTIVPEAAHERIVSCFTWDKTAEKILALMERK